MNGYQEPTNQNAVLSAANGLNMTYTKKRTCKLCGFQFIFKFGEENACTPFIWREWYLFLADVGIHVADCLERRTVELLGGIYEKKN